MVPGETSAPPSLVALTAYFLRLGAVGFGGPAALADRMREDLVEGRHWVTRPEFELGLTIAAACPGPLAYQLGVYCGYARHGIAGAFAVGTAFAAVPFALVVAVAAFYDAWSASVTVRGMFAGASPVIVAVIVRACWNLGRTTLHRTAAAWTIAAVALGVTWATGREQLWLFAAAALLGAWRLRPAGPTSPPPVSGEPAATAPRTSGAVMALTPLPLTTWIGAETARLFAFFFKTGCLVFGSGLVIVPILRSGVVDTHRWIGEQQFLDAVTIGLATPGPVVITATFVGFLVARLPGAVAATAGMFLPAILFTIVATPWFVRHQHNATLTGVVRGITAAVVGVLGGTVPLIAAGAVPDLASAGILTLALVFVASRRAPDPVVVGLGALAGALLARL